MKFSNMSKVIKGQLHLPDGIQFSMCDGFAVFTGKNDTIKIGLNKCISISSNDNNLELKSSEEFDTGMFGTFYVLVRNAINDLKDGVVVKLNMVGVGFKASVTGKFLSIYVGYSHNIFFAIPEKIFVEVSNETEILIKGYNRQQVMQFANAIRSKKKPEPYKGKGIFLNGEKIIRKEGKRS